MGEQAHRTPLVSSIAWTYLIVAVAIVLTGNGPAREATPSEVRFNRDIRPIMSDTCFKCHGPGTRKAGLRLDLRDKALKQTESGVTPIVPGKPDESEVVRRVLSTEQDEIMPPPGSHKTLTAEQKALIRLWVAQGGAL
jgi:mono/diheme cytochrome c family protein